MTRSSAHPKPAVLGGEPLFSEPVYVTRALVPDRVRLEAGLKAVLEARWFTNDGPLVRELQERVREHLDVGFCALFGNGTVALQVALRTLDLSGEVITTPFTFPATVHAIEWNGLTPVFCDIDPASYDLDPLRAAELVSERTSAILPVHVFGNPCDVLGLEALTKRHGLGLVYDAAHAFGVVHRGRSIGSYGDLSIFSFHATKIFHTAEGGAIVGSDASRFERIALLRNFGIVNEETVEGVGLNGKMSEVHAAVGLAMFGQAAAETKARARLSGRYRERLGEVEGVLFQRIAPDTEENHTYLPIEIDAEQFGLSRDETFLALRGENVFARKYFAPLCSENPSYRDLPSARSETLPNAMRLASRVLCLPNHGELGLDDVDRIVSRLVAIQANAPAIRRAIRVRSPRAQETP